MPCSNVRGISRMDKISIGKDEGKRCSRQWCVHRFPGRGIWKPKGLCLASSGDAWTTKCRDGHWEQVSQKIPSGKLRDLKVTLDTTE